MRVPLTSPRRVPVQVLAGALVVLLFAGFCGQLLMDVSRMRAQVTERVRALILLQGLDEELEQIQLGPRGEIRGRVASIDRETSEFVASLNGVEDPELGALGATLTAAVAQLTGAVGKDDGAIRDATTAVSGAADALVTELRSRNGATSRELGARWNRLGAIVFASLFFAVGLLVLMVIAEAQRQRSEALRAELEGAQRELRASRDAAEQSNRAKSRLLASVSHEFRTPMSGVLGMTDLLRTTALDAEQREFVDVIRSSGTVLMTLVEQLLDLSVMHGRQFELRHEAFDLLLATEEALVLLAPTAAGRGVELGLHWAREAPRMVVGDGPRMRQLVLNLLSNACKFTEEGRVEVRVASARSDVGVSVVRFEIEDTGPGIALEEQATLFEPFAQGSTGRETGGAGLGLAIAQHLVHAMDGQIGLESVVGEGTVFWFSLPLTVAADTRAEPRRLQEFGGKRVLVAEREAMHRAVWEEELSRVGARVHCFATEDELYEAIDEGTWLVVIGARGDDDAEALVERARARWPDGALLLTAPVGWDGPEPGRVAGVIHRPLRPSNLVARVARHVLGIVPMPPGPDESSIVGLDLGPSPDPAAPRILVADDSLEHRMFVAEILRRAGYNLRIATNGFEATELALTETFAMVLMDVRMPDMDGLEAARRIREAEAGLLHTPLVAMTGNTVRGDNALLLEAGLDDVLGKPTSPEAIRAMTAKWAGPIDEAPSPQGEGASSESDGHPAPPGGEGD